MVVKLLDAGVTLVAVDSWMVGPVQTLAWMCAARWLVELAREAVLHRYQMCPIA